MNVQRFLQIRSDLSQKGLLDGRVRNRSSRLVVVRVVRSVLQEAVHDVIPLGTESPVVNTGNRHIHEGGQTHALGTGLVVGRLQLFHRVRVKVNCASHGL